MNEEGNLYGLLANVLTGLHVLWVLAMVGGALLAIPGWLRHHPRIAVLYNGILLLTVGSWLFYGACVLTLWEVQVRAQSGQTAFAGEFLLYYLGQLGIALTAIQLSWVTYIFLAISLGAQLAWFLWDALHKAKTESKLSKFASTLLIASLLVAALLLWNVRANDGRAEIIQGEVTAISDTSLSWRDQGGSEQSVDISRRIVNVQRVAGTGVAEIGGTGFLTVGDRIVGQMEINSLHPLMLSILPNEAPGTEGD